MTRRLGLLLVIAGTTATSTLTAFGCFDLSSLWDQIQVGKSAIVMGRIIEYEYQQAEGGDRWVRFEPVDAAGGKQLLPDAIRTPADPESATQDPLASIRLTLELEEDLRPLPQRLPAKSVFKVVLGYPRESSLPTGLEILNTYSDGEDQSWRLFAYQDFDDEAVIRLTSLLKRALELRQQPTPAPPQIARWAMDLALDPDLWRYGFDSLERVHIAVAPDAARAEGSTPWASPTAAVEPVISDGAVEWKRLIEWLTDADRKRLVQAALELDPLDDRVVRTLGLDLGAASDPLVLSTLLGVEGRLEEGEMSPAVLGALISVVLHRIGLVGWLKIESERADRAVGTDGGDALATLARLRWRSDDSPADSALVRHIWSALAVEDLIPSSVFRADWWRPDRFRHLQIESN